jgi:hypothetical protein
VHHPKHKAAGKKAKPGAAKGGKGKAGKKAPPARHKKAKPAHGHGHGHAPAPHGKPSKNKKALHPKPRTVAA